MREDDTVVVHLKDPQKPKIREVIASTQHAAVPQQPVHTFGTPAAQQKTAAQEPAAPSEQERQPIKPSEKASEKAEVAKKTFLDFFRVGQ